MSDKRILTLEEIEHANKLLAQSAIEQRDEQAPDRLPRLKRRPDASDRDNELTEPETL